MRSISTTNKPFLFKKFKEFLIIFFIISRPLSGAVKANLSSKFLTDGARFSYSLLLMYGGLVTIKSKFLSFISWNRLDFIIFISRLFFRAFSIASCKARSLISEAITCAFEKLFFRAKARHPVPVPISRILFKLIFFDLILFIKFVTHSSVSCLGIKTGSLVINFKLANSVKPRIYCSGLWFSKSNFIYYS